MAGYVAKPKRGTTELPSDLPSAAHEVQNGVPDGAMFESDQLDTETGKPRRFRLSHPRTVPAQWTEIHTRERKPKDGAKPAPKR